MSSDDRTAILKRRARFIAAALAGIAAQGGCARDAEPQVCLSAPQPHPVEIPAVDGSPGEDATDTDAGLGAADAAPGAQDAIVPEPPPRVCLSEMP